MFPAFARSAHDAAQHTTQGVMVCPFLMRDMSAAELAEQLPNGFDVIALSKNGVEQYMGNLITLPLPMDRMEFINTVAMLVNSKSSFARPRMSLMHISKKMKTIINPAPMQFLKRNMTLHQMQPKRPRLIMQRRQLPK